MSKRLAAGYPGGLLLAALVLPALLLAALVALDYFILERALSSAEAHLLMLVLGVAGVVAFSVAVFGRLAELQARRLAQSRRLQALNQAGISLSSERSAGPVLQKLAELARSVGDAKYAALGIFDDTGQVREFLTAGITPEERARIGPLPVGRGILGLLQREGHPIRIADLGAHPASVGFPADHPPMRSFLGAPIRWRGETVGNLYLTEKLGGGEFTAEDEEALVTLAAQAAIAIENARLYEQIGRMAVLEERQRIGMDLHDGAIQSLYGIGLLLESAGERVATAPEETRAELQRAVDRLNATIADLRGYVLGLRPVRGSDRPLSESLSTLADRVGANALLDVGVEVSPDAERRVDPAEREAIFFVAADALGNVARHARARRVSVLLRAVPEGVALEIEDDGVGFAPDRKSGGFGMRNMHERAVAVGGRLEVDAEPGRGTRVRFVVPAKRSVLA